MKKAKFWLQFSVGIAIAVFFMWLFLRKVDWGNLRDVLASAHYIYLLPAMAFGLITYLFRAYRWHYLLYEVKPIPIKRLMPSLMIGFMGNALLPARSGEFIRAYLLSQKEKVKLSASIGTLVVDRMFDSFVLLMLIAGVLLFYPLDEKLFSQETGYSLVRAKFLLGIVATSVFFALVVFTIVLYYKKDFAARLLEKTLFFLPRRIRDGIISLFMSFTDGLHIFKNGRRLLMAIIITVIQWIFNALVFYPLYFVFGIGDKLNITSSLAVLASAAIGVTIPTSGYAGSFHLAVQIGLKLANSTIDNATAVAYAIIAHAIIFIPTVAIGIAYAIKEGVSFAQIEKTTETKSNPGEVKQTAKAPASVATPASSGARE